MTSEDETKVERGFARLEGLIQVIREEQRRRDAEHDRRIEHLTHALATVTDQIETLRKRQDAADERNRETHETALGAMRKAQDSIHDVETIGQAIVAHVERVEQSRRHDAGLAESRREEAARKHAERFEAQGKAIAALAQTVDRGVRVRPAQVAIITAAIGAIVTLVQVAGDVTKAWIAAQYAPPTSAPAR